MLLTNSSGLSQEQLARWKGKEFGNSKIKTGKTAGRLEVVWLLLSA